MTFTYSPIAGRAPKRFVRAPSPNTHTAAAEAASASSKNRPDTIDRLAIPWYEGSTPNTCGASRCGFGMSFWGT